MARVAQRTANLGPMASRNSASRLAEARPKPSGSHPTATVQSVERAFAVLSALADGPIGVTEVAERAALPKSTAARLLGSLARLAVVEQVPGETRYRLGPRIVTLAAGVRPTRSLVALARPVVADLASAVGEAAGLSVPERFLVHYVDQVDSPHPVGIRDWTGTRIPMHAVSSGLVMLAHLPRTDVDAFLASSLERFTARTVVDTAAIRERIRLAQVEGSAWTREEYAEGITSVAAAIADEDGEVVAAVHVHGPSYRFPSAGGESTVASRVVGAAARITAALRG
jgi:DNA-binding IclR family transcriptional regulator